MSLKTGVDSGFQSFRNFRILDFDFDVGNDWERADPFHDTYA